MMAAGGDARDVVRKTYFDGLDLVPGNLELMEFEHETPRVAASRPAPEGGMFFERLGRALDRDRRRITTSSFSIARRSSAI